MADAVRTGKDFLPAACSGVLERVTGRLARDYAVRLKLAWATGGRGAANERTFTIIRFNQNIYVDCDIILNKIFLTMVRQHHRLQLDAFLAL